MRMLLPGKAMLRFIMCLFILAAGGALLQPLDRSLTEAEKKAHLQPEHRPVLLGRDALGEQLSFFLLGGLRSLAAEVMVLDATTAWAKRDWPLAERRWQMVTTLNPSRPNYWINAARDMAINAAAYAINNEQLDDRERVVLSKSYFDRGLKFLEDGLAHHPDSALLYISLGDTYADLNRFPSFAQAAAAYHRAVQLGASGLYRRQEFYNLCRIRGREREAWELGRKLYESPSQRVPSLLCLLFVLQQKLDVPLNQRLSPEQLFGSAEKARRDLARFRNNSLRFPVQGIREYLHGADASARWHERAGGSRCTPRSCAFS